MEKVNNLGAALFLAKVMKEERYVGQPEAWKLLNGMRVLEEPEDECLAVFYELKTKGNKKPKRRVCLIGYVCSLDPPKMFYPVADGDAITFEEVLVEEIRKQFPKMDYRKPDSGLEKKEIDYRPVPVI